MAGLDLAQEDEWATTLRAAMGLLFGEHQFGFSILTEQESNADSGLLRGACEEPVVPNSREPLG